MAKVPLSWASKVPSPAVWQHHPGDSDLLDRRGCAVAAVGICIQARRQARTQKRVVRLRSKSAENVEADRGFRILEWASSALGGQKALVRTAGWAFRETWRTMVKELAPQSPDGDYLRPTSSIQATTGGSLPELALNEPGHAVYIGNTCPWCHRVQLAVTLARIPSSLVALVPLLDDPQRASRGGWAFDPSRGFQDPVFNAADLREVYDKGCGGRYTGRCTAPLLIDRRTQKVVSNDNIEIVRMLLEAATSQDMGLSKMVDLRPRHLLQDIDEACAWTYDMLSNGVYKAGFATQQGAYERAARDVAQGLERLEQVLDKQRFICGDKITEADVMLLPCALRFDAVYAFLFLRGACGLWRDRPSLKRWLSDCCSLPGVKSTIDLRACQESYYRTLFPLNASQIVPASHTPERLQPFAEAEEMQLAQAEALFHWRSLA